MLTLVFIPLRLAAPRRC